MSQPVEDVLKAISVLYSPQQIPEETTKADQYLQEFMKTKEAWQVIPLLLTSEPSVAFYQQRIYYGAIILKKKVCYNFKEIENFDELFKFILKCLSVYKNQKMITSHLAQSLAALCVQSNSWNDYFPLIIQNFPITDTSNIPVLLLMFSSIAEANKKLPFAKKEYLYSLHDNLIHTSPTILDFIQRSFVLFPGNALDCFNSWIQNLDISISLLNQCQIIQMIFEGIKQKNLRERSSDSFYYFMKKIRSINEKTTDEEVGICINIVQYVLKQLITNISSIVQTTQGDIEDFEWVSDFYCSLGFVLTTYIDKIDSNQFIMYYRLLDQFTCIRSIRNITRITDVVVDLTDFLNETAHESMREKICFALTETFVSMFEHVLRVQTPLIDNGDQEELLDFIDFRKDVISEFVRRSCDIVPCPLLLDTISSICVSTIPNQLDIAEASLFCFRSLARVLSEYKSEMVLSILQSIVKIESTNLHFLHTSVFCVGRYCDWIHNYAPTFAPTALQYILKYINIPELIEPVAISFENMCDGCAVDFIPLIDVISQTFSSVYQQMPQSWKVGGVNGSFSSLINGYCLVLEKQPFEIKLKYIETFIPPLVKSLSQPISPELMTALIGILTSWFDSGVKLNLQNITISFLQKYDVIPTLFRLMEFAIQNKNESLIEDIASCIRYLFFFIGPSIVDFTQTISTQMVQWWQNTHLASIVKMYSFLIRALKREDDRSHNPLCKNYCFTFIPPVLDTIFQFVLVQPKSSYTDVITECFIIISQLLDKYPLEFSDSVLQQRFIPWSLNVLDTMSGETFGTVVDSMILFFHSNRSSYSNTYLQNEGETLIRSLLSNARKFTTKTKREKVIDLMSLLYEQNPELISHKTSLVIQNEYNFLPIEIINSFASIKMKKTDYQYLLDDFFYICRETA
ncbi:hypothetical protein ENUP19_0358G0019 [Entamoeba nuttalli]|uniref:Nuclear transport receptor, putative n=2 Tax=Entamoeba nuttalli TaxID=412467 RepID=K2GHN0_ENTNP|nr:nuclear transport receptor, putative [Entamoeba nuttalli P19]EKE42201.1 nuclear transport receptor, putative [Entamoeba nuttalli P19]|eukprot:XP_008855459.1 nuclear transport receptor, putative [Entamoeba nuttalli P19]